MLQGDSSPPLLLNLCFNALMLTVNQERVKCLRYTSNILNIKHWSQFIDDTAITAFESDKQYLLNLFTKWCSWLDLIVKISKCATIGVKKSSTAAVQFEPHLMISGQKILTVKKSESFKYLGTDLHQIKEVLETDRHPLKPLDIIPIVNTYVYSKIKWEFSIYKIWTTWVKQHLDIFKHAESDTGLTFTLVRISVIWNNQHQSLELIYPSLVVSCNPKTQTS